MNRITFISDTHAYHDKLELVAGDILVHCGDFTNRGERYEVCQFRDWFESQPFRYKILICGNHEIDFEQNFNDFSQLFNRSILLNDSGCEVLGLKFWGSPRSPKFGNWAFSYYRGQDAYEQWLKIPHNIDILITHGPPANILDTTFRADSAGCAHLLSRVLEINPKIHAFGHIHESYGTEQINDTLFINCASMGRNYRTMNEPITIEI